MDDSTAHADLNTLMTVAEGRFGACDRWLLQTARHAATGHTALRGTAGG